MREKGPVSQFILEHYHHFNASALVRAAQAYEAHLDSGGKMFMTLAGAMSTAELGRSLAELIRQDKVHAICCTGANLEEDVFNLVAHEEYKKIPHWRNLTPEDEFDLLEHGFNRVTDTCIPEETAMRKVEKNVLEEWRKADRDGKVYPPHEYLWRMLENPTLRANFQIDPKNSWLLAAKEKNLPIFTPGWEDSTLGNMFTAQTIKQNVSTTSIIESGIQCMVRLSKWYTETAPKSSIGFFQIGGGIAGDFPICVVPMINQDLRRDVPRWGYFCQISDSTTSYGSYSGAFPSEKITWGKLDISTPNFIIESDATIVAPLVFAYLLEW